MFNIVYSTGGGITHPLVQRLHLHSGNLHCVVVVWWWYVVICGGI